MIMYMKTEASPAASKLKPARPAGSEDCSTLEREMGMKDLGKGEERVV